MSVINSRNWSPGPPNRAADHRSAGLTPGADTRTDTRTGTTAGNTLSAAVITLDETPEPGPKGRCKACERPPDRAWRPRAQPQGRQPRPTPRRHDRVHGAVRSGEVQPGLRHHLRRGAAPLRRVAVRLRPPVPRPDGQTGRRLHRGPLARGLHRPEVDVEEPAVHGRHDHRGLRLPAPALGAHRQAALPVCGEPITKQTPQQIVDRILEMPDGTRFQVLAPVIRERKGEYVDLLADLQTKGFARVRIDGVVHPLTDPPTLKKQEKHTIEAVVDRLTAKASSKQRITDSIETALRLAGGLVILDFVDLPEHDAHRERRSPSGWRASTTTRWRWTTSSRARSRSTRRSGPPGLHRPGHPQGGRPRTRGAGSGALAERGRHRAVEHGANRGVLPATAAGPGRGGGLRSRHAPGSGPARRRGRRCCTGSQRPGPRPIPEPLRPRPLVLRVARGRDPVGPAPILRVRRTTPRERYKGYMREVPCPTCEGARLKPDRSSR